MPIKLYIKTQARGWFWPWGHCVPTLLYCPALSVCRHEAELWADECNQSDAAWSQDWMPGCQLLTSVLFAPCRGSHPHPSSFRPAKWGPGKDSET